MISQPNHICCNHMKAVSTIIAPFANLGRNVELVAPLIEVAAKLARYIQIPKIITHTKIFVPNHMKLFTISDSFVKPSLSAASRAASKTMYTNTNFHTIDEGEVLEVVFFIQIRPRTLSKPKPESNSVISFEINFQTKYATATMIPAHIRLGIKSVI